MKLFSDSGSFLKLGVGKMLICECGEIIRDDTFRDYINTSANPSTPTKGHEKCGHIFNFVDINMSKRYSSRKELKILAYKFAQKNILETETGERFLLEIDRLKSSGNMSDQAILLTAIQKIMKTHKSSGALKD